MIYVLNPVFTGLVGLIPKLWGEIILWVLFGLLIVDFIGTVIAVWGLKKKNGRIDQIREGLGRTSKLLENTMTRRLQARMIKAYPNLEKDEKEDVFASGCGFYKLACLFFIGAFLGDITETVFCRFSMGRWMSRSSVVFGPFSIVWGLGCAMLTWILYRYREQSDRRLFLCGTILAAPMSTSAVCLQRLFLELYSGITVKYPLIWAEELIFCIVFSGDLQLLSG